VPDHTGAIRDVFVEAAAKGDVVLASGGLGPTEDDLTRHALADAAGVELELHEASLERLRAFFVARGRRMPETNRVQAMIPCGGRAIQNGCGTAPGLHIVLRGTPCYVTPGVPFEMRAMFSRDVAPALAAAGRGQVLLSRRLGTYGLGESNVNEQIADLMGKGQNPGVGTSVSFGVVSIRLNAWAEGRAEAEASLDDAEAEIRRRLGDIVFGRDDETLPGVVGRLLAQRGETVSTAESCTGGLIGALLTDVPGSSQYFLGGAVTYSNEAKTRLLGVSQDVLEARGAVSESVAQAMAEGVSRRLGSDYALSVTGVAGPAGGTSTKPVGLVYIGLSSSTGTVVEPWLFGEDSPREVIRHRAAYTALNMLRRRLGGSASEGSVGK